MHALRLTARFKDDAFQGDACLLVYDVEVMTGAILGDDVRDQFNARPTTTRIYILAPFIPEEIVKRAMFDGSIFDRVSNYFKSLGGKIFLLSFTTVDGTPTAVAIPFNVEVNPAKEEPSISLDVNLRNGWLFDLFDSNKGLILAPSGIHFGKGSKKHSTKFLRTSGILLSSAACAAIGYFTLSVIRVFQPRKIFVDTSPLISVAFAVQRIANVQALWPMAVPVSSFSSYGGMERLPRPSGREMVLISASTSGGLVKELIERGFVEQNIATLFFLGENTAAAKVAPAVCDLTFRPGTAYGYLAIQNYPSSSCPLCERGFFLAELEGDQFLLEKRAVKELSVKALSQPKDARSVIDAISKLQIILIPLYATSPHRAEFVLDFKGAIEKSTEMREKVVKLLRRYVPVPLHYVVLTDTQEDVFRELMTLAGLASVMATTKFVHDSQLSASAAIRGAGVLVFFSCLKEYSRIRDINAELRVVADQGCVAYLSAITLTESPEHLAGLKSFLTYGANGRDSFTYSAAYTLMLPFTHDERSSWDLEVELLRRMKDEGVFEAEHLSRLTLLESAASRADMLFWPGRDAQLVINNDFVYLDTKRGKADISQADIFTAVSNLLSAARVDNRTLTAPVENHPLRWQQSVYGQTLISTANFENYNDAILRAAFVRAATNAELYYSAHESSSAQMFAMFRQGIDGWLVGAGDFLPEYLLALATRRMVLSESDAIQLQRLLESSELPKYLKDFGKYF
jgi:hypothetical protein